MKILNGIVLLVVLASIALAEGYSGIADVASITSCDAQPRDTVSPTPPPNASPKPSISPEPIQTHQNLQANIRGRLASSEVRADASVSR